MNDTLNLNVSIVTFSLSSVFAYFGLNTTQFVILIFLMSVDMISGIAKSYRICSDSITSRRFSTGVISKVLYLCVPFVLAAGMFGVNMHEVGNYLVSFSIYSLILAEMYSILGNIYAFKTKQDVQEIDAIGYILRVIRNQIEKFLEDGKG